MVVVVAALVLGLVGAGLLAVMLRDRAGATSSEVTVGGLSLRIQSAEWEVIDMGHASGFAMPPSMMPGAPAQGDQRLRLQVELSNRGESPKPLSGDEFRMEGPGGTNWPVAVDSLGVSLLNPGLAISGGLHFDLPQKSIRKGDPGLVLVWDRGGKVRRIPVQLGGSVPTHSH
jgi:hypothetical protein